MSDKLKLDQAIDEAVDRATNHASVEATTEKIEGELAHQRNGWTIAGYVRKWLHRPGKPEAGIAVKKEW